MIARDILSLPGSAGHEEVEDGVTSISMEQDYSVFKAATNVAVSLLENSLIDGRDWPSFTRIAVAFQNSFDLQVSELRKVDLVFGYDGSSMAAGSRTADHATFVDKILQAEIPFCMSSAGPAYVAGQTHYDAEKWIHFSIAGKQGKASCTMHLWIPKMMQKIKHRVGTSKDQRNISQQEVRKRAQGEGEISKLILKALETAKLPLQNVVDEVYLRNLWDSEHDNDDNEDDSLESTKPPAPQYIEGKMSLPHTRSKPFCAATFPRPGTQTKQKEKEGEQRENITPSPATKAASETSAPGQTKPTSSNKKKINEKRTTNSKAAAAPEKSKPTQTTVSKKSRKVSKKPSVAKTADAGPASKKKQETPKSTLKHTAMSSSDSDSEVPLDGNHNMMRRSQSRSASRSRSRSQGRKAMSKSRSRSASRSKGKTVTFKRVIDDSGNNPGIAQHQIPIWIQRGQARLSLRRHSQPTRNPDPDIMETQAQDLPNPAPTLSSGPRLER
jgi:hypothetical protein